MKKALWIFLCFCLGAAAPAKELNFDRAIELTGEFISHLKENRVFTYDDEIKFMGDRSLFSYVILEKLGYADEKGGWVNGPPEYSYLCELIRLKGGELFLNDAKAEYILAGTPKDIRKDNSLFTWMFYAETVYVQHEKKTRTGPGGKTKVILFKYNTSGETLATPIFIDGDSLTDRIGFECTEKGIPFLNETVLKELKNHIDSLRAAPVSPGNSFRLTEEQIVENGKLALRGDLNAAFRNYRYYNFLTEDRGRVVRWLFTAAVLGHPVAINNWNALRDKSLLALPPERGEGELVDGYWLYLHAAATGNRAKADEYKVLLLKENVSEILLGKTMTMRLGAPEWAALDALMKEPWGNWYELRDKFLADWRNPELQAQMEADYFPLFEKAAELLCAGSLYEVPKPFYNLRIIAPAYYEAKRENRVARALAALLAGRFDRIPAGADTAGIAVLTAVALPDRWGPEWERRFEEQPSAALPATAWYFMQCEKINPKFMDLFREALEKNPRTIISLSPSVQSALCFMFVGHIVLTDEKDRDKAVAALRRSPLFRELHKALTGYVLEIDIRDSVSSTTIGERRDGGAGPLLILWNREPVPFP